MWKRADRVGDPIMVAHRGGVSLGAGDPSEAVQALARLGVRMIEIDVRRTLDGVLVVLHDDRIAGRPVATTTHAELRGAAVVATLAEFLDAAAGRFAIDVELKEPGYESAVLAVALEKIPRGRLVVTSFHAEALRAVRSAAPDIATGLIVGGRRTWRSPLRLLRDVAPFRRVAGCDADFLVPNQRLLTLANLRARAERRGIGLLVWTVNSRRTADRLQRRSGILGIVTDSGSLLARAR